MEIVKKYQSKKKVKVSPELISAIKEDAKRFKGVMQHIDNIGISYLSYVGILETKKARTDVIEKIEVYLKNKS